MQCPRCGWKINTLTPEKIHEIKTAYPRSFLPWTPEEDEKLLSMVRAGKTVGEISLALSRQATSLKRRLDLLSSKLELKNATAPTEAEAPLPKR